jgi:hypothetical protein
MGGMRWEEEDKRGRGVEICLGGGGAPVGCRQCWGSRVPGYAVTLRRKRRMWGSGTATGDPGGLARAVKSGSAPPCRLRAPGRWIM